MPNDCVLGRTIVLINVSDVIGRTNCVLLLLRQVKKKKNLSQIYLVLGGLFTFVSSDIRLTLNIFFDTLLKSGFSPRLINKSAHNKSALYSAHLFSSHTGHFLPRLRMETVAILMSSLPLITPLASWICQIEYLLDQS